MKMVRCPRCGFHMLVASRRRKGICNGCGKEFATLKLKEC